MAQPPNIDWLDPAEIYYLYNNVNWTNTHFDLRKSYFFSIFSKLVYHKTTLRDYQQIRRATVIPCFAYQELVLEEHSEFEELLQSLEGEIIDIVDINRHFIAVIIRFRNIIIVTIRGTDVLYDWLINLNARTIEFEGGKFHRGFFAETLEHLQLLKNENYLRGTHLYITGHSLGGALASMLGLLLHTDRRCDLKSVYTYGAPRYSNNRFDHCWYEPYACIRRGDPVPDTPPKRFGYEDPSFQIDPSGNNVTFPRGLPEWEFIRLNMLCLRAKTFPEHVMEMYVDDINEAVHLAYLF